MQSSLLVKIAFMECLVLQILLPPGKTFRVFETMHLFVAHERATGLKYRGTYHAWIISRASQWMLLMDVCQDC
ncbi:hypothetical protein BDV38DRAFT_243443 [Aspergillus pseudotamarii]|uniref:Uncharacterized protein n=1 Tax=Aspergillus pseudotamarii TaxID=132259 RepID=A0A5N6SWF7_ASPPS|nr:uncharacterized protein BDV38DRAFT_243443 [Aspergillus pseudotamarii]KAE8139028.1 hypothetical protein BDV38DRAFT_243443 [Aspergillus pseudotamarii]